MSIDNSTELLVEYLNGFAFSLVYTEENFPVPISPNIKLRKHEALEYLVSAAVAGNRCVGFFHELPEISAPKPIRGCCILVSTSLPQDLKLPIIFCRKPEELRDTFARAVKVSTDANMPVQVIIAHNALNNYTTQPMPPISQDRVSPYITIGTINARWDIVSAKQKLSAAYEYLTQSIPSPKLTGDNFVFNMPRGEFPKYIVATEAQAEQLIHIKEIHTTAAELPFIEKLVNMFCLTAAILVDVEEEKPQTKTVLCPGCPFVAIFARLNLSEHIVLTSVSCPAVEKIFPVHKVTTMEYFGLTSRKLNKQTLFITNLSEISGQDIKTKDNETCIVLADTNARSPFSTIGTPAKLNGIRNYTFPYSCNNIKRYSRLKVNAKKLTEEIILECVEKTPCPAIYSEKSLLESRRVLKIDPILCTGCRSCAVHCKTKALT